MDAELEALIDRAGREKVFAHMHANGWTGTMAPPKWVWEMACAAVRDEEGESDIYLTPDQRKTLQSAASRFMQDTMNKLGS